jgi:hypothetical protein
VPGRRQLCYPRRAGPVVRAEPADPAAIPDKRVYCIVAIVCILAIKFVAGL